MRVCSGLIEFRPTCAGKVRPKPAQPCGWSLGPADQRHETPTLYTLPRRDSDAFCISASTNSSQTSLLWEDDVFQFEFENGLPKSEPMETTFQMDKLVSASLKKSTKDVRTKKKPGMLQVALKQSVLIGVSSPENQGAAIKKDLRMSPKDLENQVKVNAADTHSPPVAIPSQMKSQVSDRDSAGDEESFIPPHIFVMRMNNANDLIPNSYRPRGLASLRQRTAVLSETGYLDGYTEMGQRPKKPYVGHPRNAFSA